MKSLVLVLVFVSAVMCQVPRPCITPPQWEARYFSYDRYRGSSVRAYLSYDSIYKRERIIDEYTLGSEDDFYDVLYLHNQNIEYRFNLKTKQCQKQALTREWRDFGIPPNATSLGESYVGSSAVPNANLLVTLWQDTFRDQQGNVIQYYGTWTYEACLPVSSVNYNQAENLNLHSSFYDITPGISNPEAFVPRKECLSL